MLGVKCYGKTAIIYTTMVNPVVIYGYECWEVAKTDTQNQANDIIMLRRLEAKLGRNMPIMLTLGETRTSHQ